MAKKILACALSTLVLYTISMSPCTLSTSNAEILQISVPNQLSMPMGGASCGYQAVFNGCTIAKALTLKGPAFLGALNNVTSDVRSRIAMCCTSSSPWIKLVTKMRSTENIKQQLEKVIALQFKGAQLVTTPLPKDHRGPLSNGERYLGTPGERITFFPHQGQAATQLDKLWPECRELSRKLAAESGIIKDGFIRYQLSASNLRQLLKEKLEERLKAACTNCQDQSLSEKELQDAVESRNAYQGLVADGTLDQFIEFQDIDIVVSLSTDTAWLKSEEVEAVVELMQKEHGKHGPVFITGNNGIDLEAPLTDDEGLKLSPEYQEFVRAFQENEGTVTGTFLIYLGGLQSQAPARMTVEDPQAQFTNEAEGKSTNGHWICLVAHRNGTERLLIIANSLYNNCTEHYRVKEVNALLRGINYASDFEAWKDSCRPVSLFSTLSSPRQALHQYAPEISEQTYIRFFAACTVLVGYLALNYLQELRSRQPQRPLVYRSPIEAMTVSGVASPLLAF
jgi:hypothetical protein